MCSPGSNSGGARWKGSKSNATGRKRPGGHDDASLPTSKRYHSASPTKAGSNVLLEREHRRVVLSHYGKAIYNASSRSALLAGMVDCIAGHQSLGKASFLHRDISINNIIINEECSEPTSFLIDLNLAITDNGKAVLGALGRIGTKAFMAIAVLLGEEHQKALSRGSSTGPHWSYRCEPLLLASFPQPRAWSIARSL